MQKVFKKWQLPLSIVLVFFGFLLAIQFKTQQDVVNSLEKSKEEDLVAVIKNLTDKRNALVTEIEDLNNRKVAINEKVNTGEGIQASVENELRELRKANGVFPLEGPGITISLTTSDNSIMYLDLVDIMNELWAIGAEAISVNDVRITNNTAITDVLEGNKTMVAINGTKLLSPITIKAIGDPKTLESGLTLTGGVFYNLSTLYNIKPEIRQEEHLAIPAVKQ